jgi:hypothetical protein
MSEVLKTLEIEKAKRYEVLADAQRAVDESEGRSQAYRTIRAMLGDVGWFLWKTKSTAFGIFLGLMLAYLTTVSFEYDDNGIDNNKKPVVTVKNTSLTSIIKAIPKDVDKRSLVSTVFKETAAAIDVGALTEMSDVLVTLKTELSSVIANKDWYSTFDAIEKMLNSEKDLKGVSDKLQKIAEGIE